MSTGGERKGGREGGEERSGGEFASSEKNAGDINGELMAASLHDEWDNCHKGERTQPLLQFVRQPCHCEFTAPSSEEVNRWRLRISCHRVITRN